MEELNLIVNSCRVCQSTSSNEAFASIFSTDLATGVVRLTRAGNLYEEVFGLQIESETLDYFPQFLCNSCDLQMRLYKELKMKAKKTLELLQLTYVKERAEEKEGEGPRHSIGKDVVRLQSSEFDGLLEEKAFALVKSSGEEGQLLDALDDDIVPIEDRLAEMYEEMDDKAGEKFDLLQEMNGSNEKAVDDVEHAPVFYILEEQVTPCDEVFVKAEDLFENREEEEEEEEIKRQQDLAAEGFVESLQGNSEEDNNTDAMSTYTDINYLDEDLCDDNRSVKSAAISKSGRRWRNKWRCFQCSLEFNRLRDFSHHRREEHGNKYPCFGCEKLFHTADALRVHSKQHELGPQFKCEQCQKTFNQKVHYEYHMNKHNNVRNFACTICDKHFLSKADLGVHTRIHNGDRRYFCEICGKDFLLMQHLKMHAFSHQTRKSFKCDICDQSFTSPATRRTHERTIHTTEKRFSCEVCRRRFRRKHHLLAHYKVHERSKDPLRVGESKKRKSRGSLNREAPSEKAPSTPADSDFVVESHDVDDSDYAIIGADPSDLYADENSLHSDAGSILLQA